MFYTAVIEFDERPGPVRDFLVSNQKRWIDHIAKAAKLGVDNGEFRGNIDCQLVAFEFQAIFPSYHFSSRLLKDPKAEHRAWKMIDKLIESIRL
ncbi:MAG: hypothetical protein HOG97_02850 [Candidatus Marinimicrobia bacterium]|jgi:hypothetical protein|nr:hypothetical protein [Candidatus Neomarinimicrobiota bacterium]MBT6871084.1 hypothetical protein [Candidatus Neomarinimicrobiota bacterium]